MLRITHSTVGGLVTAKLEGKLLGPWVDEFVATCPLPHRGFGRVVLDLSGVSFADQPGLQALRKLIEQGVEVSASSGYVAALIESERKS